MLILMERFYENPELLSLPGEIREGFQEEVIAELSSEGRVAVRRRRGIRSNIVKVWPHELPVRGVGEFTSHLPTYSYILLHHSPNIS